MKLRGKVTKNIANLCFVVSREASQSEGGEQGAGTSGRSGGWGEGHCSMAVALCPGVIYF